MKNIVIGLLLSFSIPIYIFSECPPVAQHQRDLIILPDTASEESLQIFGYYALNNFQTNNLEKILISQAVPIMVELSIWRRFTNKIKKESKSFTSLEYDFYIIKNFLLCIPKISKQLSPMGFNVASLKKIDNPFTLFPHVLDPLKGYVKSALTLVNVYSSLVTALRLLLDKDKSIAWNIVLFGHGGPGIGSYAARVGGIPIDEFKKLLRFLNNEIHTNIFLYQTCYAGSTWLLKSYLTYGKPDTYNYPIILTGLSEAPAYAWTSRMERSIYATFFQKIKTLPLCKENLFPLDLIASVLLQAITPSSKDSNTFVLTGTNNILQIRWPNSTQFETIEIDTLIATAQKSIKKEPSKPLSITTHVLVLDTPYLNVPINLTLSDHSIVSALPRKVHYIHSIKLADTYSNTTDIIKKVLSYFTGTRELISSKLFLIDTVTDATNTQKINNVSIYLNRTPIPGTTLMLSATNEVYYIVDDRGYRIKQNEAQPASLTANRTTDYIKLFEAQKIKLFQEYESLNKQATKDDVVYNLIRSKIDSYQNNTDWLAFCKLF